MANVGISSNGLTVKRLDEILQKFEEGLKSAFGSEISFDPSTPQAQLNGIYAEEIALMYEAAEAIYTNLHPHYSSGQMLDLVNSIRGVFRIPAVATRVPVEITGTNGVIVPEGSLFQAQGYPELFFKLEKDFFIGTSITGFCRCTTTGPIEVIANTLTIIVNPFQGLDSINNQNPGLTGRDVESDSAFRLRGNQSVGIPGISILDSMRAGLKALNGMDQVRVYENDENFADSLGVPGKSMWAIVHGDLVSNEDVARVIYNRKSLGCGMHGGGSPIEVEIIDSEGNPHTIRFSRAWNNDIFVKITVTTDDQWASGTEGLIKSTISNFAEKGDGFLNFTGYGIGDDCFASELARPLQKYLGGTNTSGLFHINEIKLGTSAGSTNLDMYGTDPDSFVRIPEDNIEVVMS